MLPLVVVLVIFGGMYLLWHLCRKIVRLGFMISYFLVGAIVTWFLMPGSSLVVPAIGGLSFAYAVSLIRSKIWRAISAAAVIGASSFVLPLIMPPSSTEEKKEKAPATKKKEPAKGSLKNKKPTQDPKSTSKRGGKS